MKRVLFTRAFTLAVFALGFLTTIALASCGGGASESNAEEDATEEMMGAEDSSESAHEHPAGEHPSGDMDGDSEDEMEEADDEFDR